MIQYTSTTTSHQDCDQLEMKSIHPCCFYHQ